MVQGARQALAEATKLADWNIAHSTPGEWAYGNMPYSTFEEKKPGGFRDKSGIIPDKRIVVGFEYNQWWYSCHIGVIYYLFDF